MKNIITKNDFPVYIFYFLITFCKGIDLTKDSNIYILLYIFGVFFLITRLFTQKYTLKQLLFCLLLLLTSLLVYFLGNNTTPLFASIAICSLKDINVKSILKMIFWVHLSCFILMILLSMSGIIENKFIYRTRDYIGMRKRYYLGFTHPNLAQSHLLSIIILYYYLYGKNKKIMSYLLFAILSAIIYYLTASRTSFYLSIFYLLFHFLFSNNYKVKKIIAFVGKYSFIILFLLTIFLVTTYKQNQLTNLIDQFLTGRIYYLNIVYYRYPITLFGQIVVDSKISIDNSFFGMLYNGGIIMMILMFLINYLTSKYFYKKNMLEELWAILFLNILFFNENLFLVPSINFMLLVSCSTIFELLDKKKDNYVMEIQ